MVQPTACKLQQGLRHSQACPPPFPRHHPSPGPESADPGQQRLQQRQHFHNPFYNMLFTSEWRTLLHYSSQGWPGTVLSRVDQPRPAPLPSGFLRCLHRGGRTENTRYRRVAGGFHGEMRLKGRAGGIGRVVPGWINAPRAAIRNNRIIAQRESRFYYRRTASSIFTVPSRH
ncbi:hypothetical protein SKAU_G00302140 [Synaphobranchus kaupii]|uniref:Uncharacterized protein n=1 Tax=Synaphobranchus kaupii TaxID=118154 RepID=A0A9Q1EVZ5_SYNKA|nr:hypothetical protein SKAU_G00302140 [Synaphobranchus kaupii]